MNRTFRCPFVRVVSFRFVCVCVCLCFFCLVRLPPRYHVEKRVCDKILTALHVQHGQYWDGEQAVPLPPDGTTREVGHYSPPYPTLAELGEDSVRIETMAAKVRGAVLDGAGGGRCV